MKAEETPADTSNATHVVDARGVKCPLPVLYTQKALRRLAPGRSLVVLCTDPVSVIDIPNLVREAGYVLASMERQGDDYRFTIRPSDSADNIDNERGG